MDITLKDLKTLLLGQSLISAITACSSIKVDLSNMEFS